MIRSDLYFRGKKSLWLEYGKFSIIKDGEKADLDLGSSRRIKKNGTIPEIFRK